MNLIADETREFVPSLHSADAREAALPGAADRLQIEWLDPASALLACCVDMLGLLNAGSDCVLGGARVTEPGTTHGAAHVVFWRGSRLELQYLAQKSDAVGLRHDLERVSCDVHGVIVVCVAPAPGLRFERGQRCEVDLPGDERGAVFDSREEESLVAALRSLAQLIRTPPSPQLRRRFVTWESLEQLKQAPPDPGLLQRFAKRVAREYLALRVRQLVAATGLPATASAMDEVSKSLMAMSLAKSALSSCSEIPLVQAMLKLVAAEARSGSDDVAASVPQRHLDGRDARVRSGHSPVAEPRQARA